jgi:hypothetical protein
MRRTELGYFLREVRAPRMIAICAVVLLVAVLVGAGMNDQLGPVLAWLAVWVGMLLVVIGLAALAYANRVRRGW